MLMCGDKIRKEYREGSKLADVDKSDYYGYRYASLF